MVKEPNADGEGSGREARRSAAEGKKQRLADALRRNLVKRKEKMQGDPGDKPG